MNLTVKKENNPILLARLNRYAHDWHAARYPDVFQPYDYAAFLPWFEEILTRADTCSLIAYHGEEAVGYALLIHRMHRNSPFLRADFQSILIDQMGVRPDFRNQGVGTFLMKKIKEYAGEQGIHTLHLSVWTENEQAQKFYRKAGFENYLEHMELKF